MKINRVHRTNSPTGDATLCTHVQQLQPAFPHNAPDPRSPAGLGRRLPQGARRAATPTALLRRELGQYSEALWAGGVASPQASARPTDAEGDTQPQQRHSRRVLHQERHSEHDQAAGLIAWQHERPQRRAGGSSGGPARGGATERAHRHDDACDLAQGQNVRRDLLRRSRPGKVKPVDRSLPADGRPRL